MAAHNCLVTPVSGNLTPSAHIKYLWINYFQKKKAVLSPAYCYISVLLGSVAVSWKVNYWVMSSSYTLHISTLNNISGMRMYQMTDIPGTCQPAGGGWVRRHHCQRSSLGASQETSISPDWIPHNLIIWNDVTWKESLPSVHKTDFHGQAIPLEVQTVDRFQGSFL